MRISFLCISRFEAPFAVCLFKQVMVAVAFCNLPKLLRCNTNILAESADILRGTLAIVLFDHCKALLAAHAAKADKLAHLVRYLAEAVFKILDHLVDEDKIFVERLKWMQRPALERRVSTDFESVFD